MGGCGDMFSLGAKMWNYPVIGTPSLIELKNNRNIKIVKLNIFKSCFTRI
jgi:hypothetical protein